MNGIDSDVSGFVLIPEQLYNSKILKSQSSIETTTEESTNTAKQVHEKVKRQILKKSQYKSKLVPYITPTLPTTPVETSPPTPQPSTPPTIPLVNDERIDSDFDATSQNIISGLPLEGIKLKRSKILLKKFHLNHRLNLSTRDTIIIDGIDTNVSIGEFLTKLQLGKKPLGRKYREIKNILGVEPHQWITIK